MRALAVVGLGVVCSCAASPKADVGAQGVTSDASSSAERTSTNVESSEVVSSFAPGSEATSEPETSSSSGDVTSVVVDTSAPAPSSTSPTSSEPATSTELSATSETSAASSAATSSEAASGATSSEETTEVEPAPELTMENVVDVLTELGADLDPSSGFRFYILPAGDEFVAGREDEQRPPIPRFDPPVVAWAEGCEGLKAVFRVPIGMCLMVTGKLKTAGQIEDPPSCEPDLVIPTCSDAAERVSRTRSTNLEPDHTETLTVRAFAYSDEQCVPDGAPSWSAVLYKGACTTD